ncbi:type I-E CRISPR-associated protein Cas7/Cse4/CasC [Nicoliella lavandulae]|uniref:Type I-E CRISPR-associated protein Cas7/Cse4/CasC n=1 Tax=Nicoliella lavandulae TaxID=3082954 RepID=A0ABU8SNE5_9LACO
MTKNNLYIDIHAIETVPPSNINRDDAGSPKTALYGGAPRSRVSSQAWKKVMRDYFVEHLDENKLGIRTLELVKYIADKIQNIDSSIDDDKSMEMAETVISKLGIKMTTSKSDNVKKHKVLKALFFIGNQQANDLANAAINGVSDKKELAEILKSNPAVDITLFGRMVADDPNLNEDASAQVSHAISTHAVRTEFDFFTATDDFSQSGHSGAGMLGTTEYNSSTLYRYANISGHELLRQLGSKEDTVKAINLFIKAFAKTMPSGKITSFANQTLPQSLVVTIRKDRPVNLVTGFEKPVASNDGYVNESIQRLSNEFDKASKWVDSPEATLSIGMPDSFGNNNNNLDELLDKVSSKLNSLL